MEFDPIARFYDADHGRLQEDIPVILGFAQKTGGPVLDLGVGTGRLALPLAQAGYPVAGVDNSTNMLELARVRISTAGLSARISLHHTDFSDFDLGQHFGLAWCGYNSFLHLLETEDQLAALHCWRRHLRPGGLLGIDIHNPNLGQLAAADSSMELADRWRDEQSGHTIYKFHAGETHFADQIYTIHMIYDEVAADGAVRRSAAEFDTRILFRRELELLLQHASFQNIRCYGDCELSPWEPDSERIIAVAQA